MTFIIDHAFKTGLIKKYKSENKLACECNSLSTPVEFPAKSPKRRGEMAVLSFQNFSFTLMN